MAGSPIGLLLVLTDAAAVSAYSTIIDTPGAIPITGRTVTPVFVGSASTHSAGRRAGATSWNPNWNKRREDELAEVREEIADVSEEIRAQQVEVKAAESKARVAIRADIGRLKAELKDLKAYERSLLDDEEAVLLMLLTH